MGHSDLIILAVSLVGFVCLGFFIVGLTKQRERGAQLNQHHEGDDGEQHRGRGGNLRRRRGAGVADNDGDDVDDDIDEQDLNGDNEPNLAGMTKKEMAKIEKRRAKAQQREAMDAEREDRKEKEEARMQQLREREFEKEEEFRVLEAQRQRDKAAQEHQKQLAYNHWKDPFPDHVIVFPLSSPSAGKGLPWEKSSEEVADVKERFIAFINNSTVVSLQELSSKFSIPTFNCIELLKSLVTTGDICGAFVGDDYHFEVVNARIAKSVISLAEQQGTLSMTDMSKVVQA